jgi:folate-binding protein YgfZ
MTEISVSPPAFVLGAADVSPSETDALLDTALVAEADVAVVEVTGPGALQCLQGLLTNDLEKAGSAGFLYGAVLTPKGMIVCDMWVARNGTKVTLFPPRHGLEVLLNLFRRVLPPRLAQATERSDELAVLRVAGPEAITTAQRAGIAIPAEGRAESTIAEQRACVVAHPGPQSPFAIQIVVARTDQEDVISLLERAGAIRGTAPCLEMARILAGWPRLGAEIDDKTLPQEVRFDEINGVSYTKGCYTGQETVARVHFRGHPNRQLAGLVWDEAPALDRAEVVQDQKLRGRVTSIAWLAPVERYVGLAILRREVDRDRTLTAAGESAGVVEIPFEIDG